MNGVAHEPSAASFARANRAFGAILFSGFGGAWLSGWSVLLNQRFAPVPLGCIGLLTVALLWFTYRRYKSLRRVCGEEPSSDAKRVRDRWFNIINAGQWLVIFTVASLLNARGLAVWIFPMIVFVVGFHFVLLSRLFSSAAHAVTGIAMMSFAGSFPFIAAGGPSSPSGLLGAGLILWASALWAVRPQRRAS